jgi:hypothetical protein
MQIFVPSIPLTLPEYMAAIFHSRNKRTSNKVGVVLANHKTRYNTIKVLDVQQRKAQLSCKIHSTNPSVRLLWLLDTRACSINCRLLACCLPVETEDENIDSSTLRDSHRLIYTNCSNLIMLIACHFQSMFENKVSHLKVGNT